ncbi:MAG: MarR family transcriptional regulator [Promethearchaeota archaeon Loki_b32]|nr:MAG: MarR family transcriptional regulator [Candidatus Lokiarchaeota archaeon Loki_b32]
MEKLREGGFLMAKIRKLSERIFAKLLRDFKITELSAAQGRVIFPLWQKDDISFQELKTKTALSKATLSHMLDNLEKGGHIKRVRSKKDKRTIYIKLTKKNQSLQDKFLQVSNEMRDIYYKDFSEKDIDEFENYLRKLLDNLTKFSEKNK